MNIGLKMSLTLATLGARIPVPWEMANNLMVLHSYTLARLHVRSVSTVVLSWNGFLVNKNF